MSPLLTLWLFLDLVSNPPTFLFSNQLMRTPLLLLVSLALVAAWDAMLLVHGSNEASRVALADYLKLQKEFQVDMQFTFAVMDADVNDLSQLPPEVRNGPWPRLLLIKDGDPLIYYEVVGEIHTSSLTASLIIFAAQGSKALRPRRSKR